MRGGLPNQRGVGDPDRRWRWLEFLRDYRVEHPELSFREARRQAEAIFTEREAQRSPVVPARERNEDE